MLDQVCVHPENTMIMIAIRFDLGQSYNIDAVEVFSGDLPSSPRDIKILYFDAGRKQWMVHCVRIRRVSRMQVAGNKSRQEDWGMNASQVVSFKARDAQHWVLKARSVWCLVELVQVDEVKGDESALGAKDPQSIVTIFQVQTQHS